ncbi:MAG: hypothetical protein ACYS3S_04750 [Planctomycetota bacterium]|jgi:hypothetical protein
MIEAANKQGQNAKISVVAVATLFESVLIIPFLVLSAYRIIVHPCLPLYMYSDEFSLPLDLSAQTYMKLHSLCNILPLIPVIFGVVALIQIALSSKELHGKTLAISGIIIAVMSCLIYWISVIVAVMGPTA